MKKFINFFQPNKKFSKISYMFGFPFIFCGFTFAGVNHFLNEGVIKRNGQPFIGPWADVFAIGLIFDGIFTFYFLIS